LKAVEQDLLKKGKGRRKKLRRPFPLSY